MKRPPLSVCLAVAIAALVLPIVVAPALPMTDLPAHEELVAILRHRHDAAMYPPDLYEVHVAQPNILFHLAALAASYLLGIRLACRLVVAAAVGGLVLGAGRLATHFERPAAPAAFLVAPLAMGWLFAWGLAPNLLGLAGLVLVLPALDAFAASPTRSGALRMSLVMVLLFWAHESATVFAALALIVFALTRRQRTALVWTPVGFAAVLAALHHARVHFELGPEALPLKFDPPLLRIADVPRLIGGGANFESVALAVVFVGALAPFLVARLRARERSSLHALRLEIIAGLGLLAYLVAPTYSGDMTMIHQRFFAPAMVLFVIALPGRGPSAHGARPSRASLRWRTAVAASVPLATLLARAPSFADAARAQRMIETLEPHISQRSSFGYIHVGPTDPMRAFSVTPTAARIAIDKGGRVLSSFANIPHSPVTFRPGTTRWEAFRRIGADGLALRPSDDLRMIRYLLVHTNDARGMPSLAAVLNPEAKFVDSDGEWFLFESRLPLMPLTAPEPPPTPGATSLRERLDALQRAPTRKP